MQLNGLSATQYRQNLYFGTGYNIPDFIFEDPKVLPEYPIYEINYMEKASYDVSLAENKSIRIFSVYESDLSDEQKKLYTNSIYLNKDENNSTESITKYLISSLLKEPFLLNKYEDSDMFIYLLKDDALLENYPEEIAKTFTDTSKFARKLKPSDIPYIVYILGFSRYITEGIANKDSFLFLEDSAVKMIDFDKMMNVKSEKTVTHEGSLFLIKSFLFAEKKIGKNIIIGMNSESNWNELEDGVIIGVDVKLENCKIRKNTYIYERVACAEQDIGAYQEIKSSPPSILGHQYKHIYELVSFLSAIKG